MILPIVLAMLKEIQCLFDAAYY